MNMKRCLATACVGLVGLTSNTGCIGGMAVSGKVLEFNLRVASGKWPRAIIFVLLYVCFVYPIAGLIDLIIVNSIEFHTGTNPVSGEARIARAGDTYREVAPDGTAAVSTLREDGSIDFWITTPDGSTTFLNLQDAGERLVARDAEGATLGSVTQDGLLSTPAGG